MYMRHSWTNKSGPVCLWCRELSPVQTGLRPGESGGGDAAAADRSGAPWPGGDQLCGELLPGGPISQGPGGHQEGNNQEDNRESSYQPNLSSCLLISLTRIKDKVDFEDK